jgi:hypothetical protein
MTGRHAGLVLKVGGSVLVAGIVAALFLLGRPAGPPAGGDGGQATDPGARTDRTAAIALIDAQIDTVLGRFGVVPATVKKHSFSIPEENFTRTERLVPLPDSVAPVSVNAALNDMARRHGGRAVASENPRLGTVTIHIEVGGAVVHSVILKKIPRTPLPGGRQLRPAT